MPGARGARPAAEGTRFKLFPQPSFLEAYREPVVVTLSPRAGTLAPGPSDGRMYALIPEGRVSPYGQPSASGGRVTTFLPPWRGPRLPPALPDRAGHFDHLQPSDPAFPAAHAFGCVRLVLDVWERFCGPIPWHFRNVYPRLEISSIHDYENAQSGFGYLQLGTNLQPRGPVHLFALNFDVVAHECGHLILFSVLGLPRTGVMTAEFRGFHELMADLVALVAAASFDAVVDDVLLTTKGNLYLANELNRFAELSSSDQVRNASNSVKLSEFRVGWRDEHDLSLPLTGAIFDVLVEIYQLLLVERRLVDPRVVQLSKNLDSMLAFQHPIEAMYTKGYAAAPQGFRQTFHDARKLLAAFLAHAWRSLRPDGLTYRDVGLALLAADRAITGGRFRSTIEESFAWRDIWTTRVGPLLGDLPTRSHTSSARCWHPGGQGASPGAHRRAV